MDKLLLWWMFTWWNSFDARKYTKEEKISKNLKPHYSFVHPKVSKPPCRRKTWHIDRLKLHHISNQKCIKSYYGWNHSMFLDENVPQLDETTNATTGTHHILMPEHRTHRKIRWLVHILRRSVKRLRGYEDCRIIFVTAMSCWPHHEIGRSMLHLKRSFRDLRCNASRWCAKVKLAKT